MRRIYVVREVGEQCETCNERSGDQCRLFGEQLYSRARPGGAEYLMLEACRAGASPPIFKPGVR